VQSRLQTRKGAGPFPYRCDCSYLLIRWSTLLLLFHAQVTLVTLDLSFISVLKVMPALAAVMAPGAQMVVLIKPQFEAGRAQVGTGGLVKDSQVG
jgi:hypothetical protein